MRFRVAVRQIAQPLGREPSAQLHLPLGREGGGEFGRACVGVFDFRQFCGQGENIRKGVFQLAHNAVEGVGLSAGCGQQCNVCIRERNGALAHAAQRFDGQRHGAAPVRAGHTQTDGAIGTF